MYHKVPTGGAETQKEVISMNASATKNPGKAQVYTIHSMDEVDIDTRVRALSALTEDEARDLTTQIRRTSVRLWLLVCEAHDRKAHQALGYENWADYVRAELNMSESRSYQLLDTGHVMKALAGAGIDVESISPPPARVVSRVKDRLTDVRKLAAEAVKKGEPVDKAIRALAREPRKGAATAGAAAETAEGGDTDTVQIPTQKVAAAKTAPRGQTEVPCPACAGSGKVTQQVADRLLELIQKL